MSKSESAAEHSSALTDPATSAPGAASGTTTDAVPVSASGGASASTGAGVGANTDSATGTSKASGSTATWAITLFGTAVGAGVLFLPIDAGAFGFWPLLAGTLLIAPICFYSHRMYSRIVSASSVHGENLLERVTNIMGRPFGLALGFCYWMGSYPTVLIYAISATNTLDSFLSNQVGVDVPRNAIAIGSVLLLTGAYALGRRPMLWLANLMIYPLIATLFITSVYLIPRWDFSSFYHYADFGLWDFVKATFLILPVLMFSLSHDAALSQFSLDMQRAHGKNAEKQVTKTERYATVLLVVFVMFFVWSCVLALGADGMHDAEAQNIPVLSYFANVTNTPFMSVMTPVIALCAVCSSYFGFMLGSEESTQYLFKTAAPKTAERMGAKKLNWATYLFVIVTASAAAIINPSILDLISIVGGIFVATTVFISPMFVYQKHKDYAKYRHLPSNYFVFACGIALIITTLIDLFG